MPETEFLSIPLFPLQAVLFPGGLLSLKVFEARYLDLISACMRENKPFGVMSLRQGSELRKPPGEKVAMEDIGTLAQLIEVDSAQHGILQVRSRGTQRFHAQSREQQADGLWLAQAKLLDNDELVPPCVALLETVRGLASAIATLKQQGSEPFLKPFVFESAGWVANRWCEILPISIAAKQKLMELADPMVRLQLVDEFLRTKGVVK